MSNTSESGEIHSSSSDVGTARWIGWSTNGTPEGRPNRFAWFQRIVELPAVPAESELRFAADSTARLWINGVILRRKVARNARDMATCEVVDCSSVLRPGKNILTVLLHHWGDITTFQRTAGGLAGLWVDSSWVVSDSKWKTLPVEAYEPHTLQILGLRWLTPRIRFPQIIHAARMIDIHNPDFDTSSWPQAVVLENFPWPVRPLDVETKGQRDEFVLPPLVLAAGQSKRILPVEDDPALIGPGLTTSTCEKNEKETVLASSLCQGKPWTISGKAGDSLYVTVDFQRPLHGYPLIDIGQCPWGTRLDFGYGEIWRRHYDGRILLRQDGWLDTGRVVGSRYADRIIISGPGTVELPDERTCRWLTLHIHFYLSGTVTINRLGIISSQHPFNILGSCTMADEQGERDDSRVAGIVRLCSDHATVSMTDAIVDTPGREDGQWLEDATPRAELCARWSGETSLRYFYLRTVSESQNKVGVFHNFPPSNFPNQTNMADWQMQWGQMLWDEWIWSGDENLVRRFFPTLSILVATLLERMDAKGLWHGDVNADINTTPPVPKGGVSGVVAPWLITRLIRFAALARVVGNESLASAWEAAAELMKQAFKKHLLVPGNGQRPTLIADVLDADLKPLPSFSQAAHSEALGEGIIDPELAGVMLDYIFPEPNGVPPSGILRWNNPTYSERVLKALSRNQRGARALRHLLERYSQYLPGDPANPTPPLFQGPHGGPLPEYWISREDQSLRGDAINHAQPGDETGSHGWGAVPLLWLHEYVLGVTIASPGGKKLRITPDLCGRKFIRGKTCTPRGLVELEAHESGSFFLQLPAETEALVTLPFANRQLKGKAQQLDGNRWQISGPGRWETV